MLQVPNEGPKELSTKLSKRYHLLGPDAIKILLKLPTVPHKNVNCESDLQAATSFSPAASKPVYENGTRRAVIAIAPQQEGHYANILNKKKIPA